MLPHNPLLIGASQWITIGGSYSGALSAWFRLKYPHLTIGAVSSSGVVNAIYDFTAFDQQGASCDRTLRHIAAPDCRLGHYQRGCVC